MLGFGAVCEHKDDKKDVIICDNLKVEGASVGGICSLLGGADAAC